MVCDPHGTNHPNHLTFETEVGQQPKITQTGQHEESLPPHVTRNGELRHHPDREKRRAYRGGRIPGTVARTARGFARRGAHERSVRGRSSVARRPPFSRSGKCRGAEPRSWAELEACGNLGRPVDAEGPRREEASRSRHSREGFVPGSHRVCVLQHPGAALELNPNVTEGQDLWDRFRSAAKGSTCLNKFMSFCMSTQCARGFCCGR